MYIHKFNYELNEFYELKITDVANPDLKFMTVLLMKSHAESCDE